MSLPTTFERSPQDSLLILYTGGTFGMQDHGRGLESAPDLGEVIQSLMNREHPDQLSPAWRYLRLPRIIDSADATFTHALAVAAIIRKNLTGIRGVIVIHGTDTLAYTAAVTAFALADVPVPIVFTGAQRPISESGSDAPKNFSSAYAVASGSVGGVHLVFGGRALPAVRALKVASEADEAFEAFRTRADSPTGISEYRGRLGSIDSFADPEKSHRLPPVGILKIFPGFVPELLTAAGAIYPGGIVLECYGAGTAPTSTPGFVEALAELSSRGVPLVAITQCLTGQVSLERYAVGVLMHEAGAIDGSDLTADGALAKLSFCVALGLDLPATRQAFRRNLIGEQRPV